MKTPYIAALQDQVATAVFLCEEQLEATVALLPEAVRPSLTPEAIADSNSLQYITPQATYLIYGLGKAAELTAEKLRKTLHGAIGALNKLKATQAQVVFLAPADVAQPEVYATALGETPTLSSYEFNKYKKKPKDPNTLTAVAIYTNLPQAEQLIEEATKTANATCIARDLVNEPPNVLTAVELANRARELGEEYGFRVEIFEKTKIESLKMGGLLSVNRGSQDPPTFSILEWKPANATNTQPIVLVGKGLVFDTGGLSLKPTAGSMDSMKCDMAGGAAVIGAFVALAANNIPRHVIGLIPSTDNRPGENAYCPQDVITMYDGTTVEVLNTDAEGRMILADALSFAKQYNPQLVIDLATLTGAAVVAVGTGTTAVMSTANDTLTQAIIQSGFRTHERLVQLPLWPEYREQLNSDIADLKNIGGRYAGSITAGKFLEHFTDYPWIHLDIAGPAFLETADSYRGKNGTGVGVRLLYDFIRNNT
jgi:leucyl aminopeptidase